MNLSEKDIKRFWSKVNVRSENECWLWTGGKNWKGYGTVRLDGKMRMSHRVSFFIANGYFPEDVHHNKTCPKACCNPSHLSGIKHGEHSILTRILGQVDYSKVKGDKHWMRNRPDRKITKEQAEQIREMRQQGVSSKEIARLFGISQPYASRVSRGERWE